MKKHSYSKFIVAFCILEMTVMQVWSMKIAGEHMFLVTGLLTANHAVFGGELLLLCLKRIFERSNKNPTHEKGGDIEWRE